MIVTSRSSSSPRLMEEAGDGEAMPESGGEHVGYLCPLSLSFAITLKVL